MKILKILILFFLWKTNLLLSKLTEIDKIVAITNQHIILDSEIKDNMKIIQRQNPHNSPLTNIEKNLYYQEILNQKIIDNLILQVALQKNIEIPPDQVKKKINSIAHTYNMTLEQFQNQLFNIGYNYKKYYSYIHKEMLKNIMYQHIVTQRIKIEPKKILSIATKQQKFIDFNKQFKFIEITLSLPIQSTKIHTKLIENISKNIKNTKDINNFLKTAHTYYSVENIFQIIKIEEKKWTSWKDMPTIFDSLLQTAKINEIIGPVYTHDGVHILVIQNIRYKNLTLPLIKLKTKIIAFNTPCINIHNASQKLLKIKKEVDDGNTTLHMVALKNPQTFHIISHDDDIPWQNLNEFSPNIQKKLISLKKNETSMPLYITDIGWCLIQLIDINTINYNNLMYERAYTSLFEKKFNEIINDWIQELKSTSYIKIIN